MEWINTPDQHLVELENTEYKKVCLCLNCGVTVSIPHTRINQSCPKCNGGN